VPPTFWKSSVGYYFHQNRVLKMKQISRLSVVEFTPALLALWLTFIGFAPLIAAPPICPLTINSNVVQPSCFGENGSVALTTTGGTAPYTYQWSQGSRVSSVVLAVGVYFVTVTDANGCFDTARFEIRRATALQVRIIPTRIACGTNVTGAATANITGGTAPYTYRWSEGSTTPSVSSLSAGSYGLTITDASGCTAIATATIENPVLQYSSASIFERCDRLLANRQVRVSIYLHQSPQQFVDGISIQFPSVQGLNLVEVLRDTALDTIATSRRFDTYNGVSTIALYGSTTMRGRSIVRDTGRLVTLVFELDNTFALNVLHQLAFTIHESFEVSGGRYACSGSSRVRIEGNNLVDVFNVVGSNINDPNKWLIRSAVPMRVSTYNAVGAMLNTYLPNAFARFDMDKTGVVFMDCVRKISDTTIVINTINSADVNVAFELLSGRYPFKSDWRTYLSADTDGDRQIDAGDLTRINKRSVMLLRHLTAYNHEDWIAITDSMARIFERQQFSATNLPQISSNGLVRLELASRSLICQKDSLNLHWVLLGDVNNNWTTANDVQLRSNKTVQIDVCKSFQTPEGLAVPLSISNVATLKSFYFKMPSRARLVSAKSNLVSLKEDHNRYETTNLLSAYSEILTGEAIKDSTTVIYLVFAENDLKQADFAQFEAHINGELASLKINWQADCKASSKKFSVGLFPNPTASGYVSLNFELPTLNEVHVKLMDVNGRFILSKTLIPTSLKFTTDLDLSEKVASGVYFIDCQTNGERFRSKLVIAK
jgi:SprB repeat/Secretion system C-terminal sorting domain